MRRRGLSNPKAVRWLRGTIRDMNTAPRLAIVTGASTGIGRAVALRFARAGWDCLAGVRTHEAHRRWMDAAAADTAVAHHVVPITLDVTLDTDRDAALREIRARGGRLHALVNAAGIASPGAYAFGADATDRAVVETNLLGPMAFVRRLLPVLRAASDASGHTAPAVVVNVASIAGLAPMPWQSAYHAAKFGLIGWGDAIDHELRSEGVRVVSIVPGTVRTPMLEKADAILEAAINAMPPSAPRAYRTGLNKFRRSARLASRFATTPQSVADVVVNLASTPNPPTRVAIGADAHVIRAIVQWLPHAVAMAVLRRLLG